MKTNVPYYEMPPLEALRSVFSVCGDTGKLINKRTHGKAKKGAEAGFKANTGYWHVSFKGKRYKRSRVIYYMLTGFDPKAYQVDHINHDKLDDRRDNLRLVTNSGNQHNLSKSRSDSSTGLRGVRKAHEGTYYAQLRIMGNTYLKGPFLTPEEAHEQYMKLRNEKGID